MLRYLQIRDYAIVDSLELDFSTGFTCITGETGAGKSILVGALGLLCGNRADTTAVRSGACRAELSAVFELAADSPALRWLREAEMDDRNSCLLRRVISDNGRSRAWVNGTAVTLQQLSGLGDLLVEIHGQHEHISLLRSERRFRLLDGSGEYDEELSRTRRFYLAWYELLQEQASLLDQAPLDAGDLELMQYQVSELEEDMLSAPEFLETEAEHRKLARSGEIMDSIERSLQALDDEQTGAAGAIRAAVSGLEDFSNLDPDIAGAASLMHEAAINLDEARNALQAVRSRLDVSPERFIELERRLGRQHDLARKHRAEPDRLEQVLERMRERLERAGSLETRLEQLSDDLESALAEYRRAAEDLHVSRTKRAQRLSSEVTALMQELGMQGGSFEFQVIHDPGSGPAARGSDRLELLVSTNPGNPAVPLRKVASGGELSRLSLAVKVTSSTDSAGSTQVFDEVDAGIGGESAHAVGALLRSLAAEGQALCVTHLAQVAVFADHQLQVQKLSSGSETRVETSLLEKTERIDEIARMLGGRLSEQSRAHASELIDSAVTRH